MRNHSNVFTNTIIVDFDDTLVVHNYDNDDYDSKTLQLNQKLVYRLNMLHDRGYKILVSTLCAYIHGISIAQAELLYKEKIESVLKNNKMKYDGIIFGGIPHCALYIDNKAVNQDEFCKIAEV